MSTPSLQNREEFEKLLVDYHPSSAAQKVLDETPLVLMLAATASGRNTIIKELSKTGHYHFIVSDTTRPPRFNNGVLEQNGVEYFFRTEAEMLEDIKAGRFIEAEVIHRQQVSGTSIREFERAHALDKVAVTDVDLGGSLAIGRLKKDAILIFIVPPSFDEWLRRIKDRSNPTPQEVRRRIETAVTIFRTVLEDERFICVVNDDLDEAAAEVDAAARLGQVDESKQVHARQLMRELLAAAQAYLADVS